MSTRPLLNILDYQPQLLAIIPTAEYRADVPQTAQITTTFNVARHQSENQRFALGMSCRFFADAAEHNLPYTTQIVLSGEFYSLLKLQPNRLPMRVANNALMILYGIARGIVGQATAGGVNGRFVLPSVAFDELVMEATRNPTSGVVLDETAAAAATSGRPAKKQTKSTRR